MTDFVKSIGSSVGFPSLVGVKPLHKNWGSSKRVVSLDDSGIRTEVITHAHEPGVIYTKTTQDNADMILNRNQRMRIEEPENDLTFGRHVGCIPFNEYEILKKKYPDITSKDKEIRQKALMKLMKSPEFLPYLVVPRNKV